MRFIDTAAHIVVSNQHALNFLFSKKVTSERKYKELIENVVLECEKVPTASQSSYFNILQTTLNNADQALSLETAVLLQILAERITLLNAVISKKYIQRLLSDPQSIDLAELGGLLGENAFENEIVAQLKVLNRLIPVISIYLKKTEDQYFEDRVNYDTYSLACFSLAFGACLLAAGAFGMMILTGAPVLFPTLMGLAIFASCAALMGSGFNAASFLVAIKLNAFSQDRDIQKFVKLDDCRTDMKQQLSEVETPIINSVLNQSNEKVQFESHDKLSSYGFDKYSTLFRPTRSINKEDLPLKKVSEIIEQRCLASL